MTCFSLTGDVAERLQGEEVHLDWVAAMFDEFREKLEQECSHFTRLRHLEHSQKPLEVVAAR